MSQRTSPQQTKADRDNRAVQRNDTSDAYWRSRGETERPSDWETRREQGGESPK